jgi:hypothetical protein
LKTSTRRAAITLLAAVSALPALAADWTEDEADARGLAGGARPLELTL